MKSRYLYAVPFMALGMGAAAPCHAAAEASRVVAAVSAQAEKMDPVGLLPADVGAVFALYDIPSLDEWITNLDRSPERGEYRSPIPFTNLAIAVGPGPVEWLDNCRGVGREVGAELVRTLADCLKEDVSADRYLTVISKGILKVAATIDFSKSDRATAPFMVAFNLTEDGLKDWREEMKDLDKDAPIGGVTVYDKSYNGIDCRVIEVDGSKFHEAMAEDLHLTNKDDAESIDGCLNAVLKRMDGNKLYIAIGSVKNTEVIFVTTNPEKQVRVADSAAQSVMARPDFNMAAAGGQHPAFALAYVSPEMMGNALRWNSAYFEGMADEGRTHVKELCANWADKNAVGTLKAYDGFTGRAKAWYNKMIADCKGLSFYGWRHQGLQMEFSLATDGLLKLEQPSTMSAVQPSEGDVFYYSGCLNMEMAEQYRLMFEDVAQFAWNITDAYASYSENKAPGQLRSGVSVAKSNLGIARELWAAFKDVNKSMTGAAAFVFDLQGPKALELDNMASPRFALVAELKDRVLLGKAWDRVQKAVSPLVPLFTGGRYGQIPQAKADVAGDITVYSYDMPMGEQLQPVVTVSDNRWGLSMPREFGIEITEQSKGAPADVEPLEVRLNLLPLRDALKDIKDNSAIEEFYGNLKDIAEAIRGFRFSGKKAPDGRDVFRLHIISDK